MPGSECVWWKIDHLDLRALRALRGWAKLHKSDEQWCSRVWVAKSTLNGANLLMTQSGVMRSRTLRRLEPGRNVRGSPCNVGAPLHLNVSLLQHKSTPPDDAGTTPARIQTTVTAESAAADGHMNDAESLSVAPNPIMATSAHFCAMGNAVEMVAGERFVLRCSIRRTRAGRERDRDREKDRQTSRQRETETETETERQRVLASAWRSCLCFDLLSCAGCASCPHGPTW